MSSKKDLLALLMEQSPRKASDLAKELSVTSRTVYRWVEKLQDEGFVISTEMGRNGGIYLNRSEKKSDIPSKKTNEQQISVAEKTSSQTMYDWLEIDFSQEEIAMGINTKFSICKEAIFTKHVLNFTYHLPQNKILICTTEPVKFFFHENEWHILAWIRQVEKFKVFKLMNMTDLLVGPEKHNRECDFLISDLLKK